MMRMAHLKYSLKVSWLVCGCARVISSDTGLGDRLPGLVQVSRWKGSIWGLGSVGVVRYQGGRIPGMV